METKKRVMEAMGRLIAQDCVCLVLSLLLVSSLLASSQAFYYEGGIFKVTADHPEGAFFRRALEGGEEVGREEKGGGGAKKREEISFIAHSVDNVSFTRPFSVLWVLIHV